MCLIQYNSLYSKSSLPRGCLPKSLRSGPCLSGDSGSSFFSKKKKKKGFFFWFFIPLLIGAKKQGNCLWNDQSTISSVTNKSSLLSPPDTLVCPFASRFDFRSCRYYDAPRIGSRPNFESESLYFIMHDTSFQSFCLQLCLPFPFPLRFPFGWWDNPVPG